MLKNKKALAWAIVTGTGTMSMNAMALTQADADGMVTAILAAAGIAIAAGYSIMAVVKAAKIGIALLGSFLSNGARA